LLSSLSTSFPAPLSASNQLFTLEAFLMKAMTLLFSVLFLISCQSLPKVQSAKSSDARSNVPKLTKPVVKRVWVPEKIEENGSVFEEGHWRYLLQHNSNWSR
jgi:hypothetical protein